MTAPLIVAKAAIRARIDFPVNILVCLDAVISNYIVFILSDARDCEFLYVR